MVPHGRIFLLMSIGGVYNVKGGEFLQSTLSSRAVYTMSTSTAARVERSHASARSALGCTLACIDYPANELQLQQPNRCYCLRPGVYWTEAAKVGTWSRADRSVVHGRYVALYASRRRPVVLLPLTEGTQTADFAACGVNVTGHISHYASGPAGGPQTALNSRADGTGDDRIAVNLRNCAKWRNASLNALLMSVWIWPYYYGRVPVFALDGDKHAGDALWVNRATGELSFGSAVVDGVITGSAWQHVAVAVVARSAVQKEVSFWVDGAHRKTELVDEFAEGDGSGAAAPLLLPPNVNIIRGKNRGYYNGRMSCFSMWRLQAKGIPQTLVTEAMTMCDHTI